MSRWILSLFLLVWISVGLISDVESQFNMYEIEQNITIHHPYYHCLLYYTADDTSQTEYVSYGFQHQIIPYCIRPSNISYGKLLSERQSLVSNKSEVMTFYKLSQQGVNSAQLLAWSASIDLVERYQIYLNNPTVFLSQQIFYKCSPPWFGPQCQYKFIYEGYYSFRKVVESTFQSLKKSRDINDVQGQTCYVHLTCIRGPSPVCLDWREVCDGKVDCLDGGQDERNCFPLEINECNKNEYRCHNGMQCIPLEFLNDFKDIPDCIDRSDERHPDDSLQMKNIWCNKDPSFRCEEHSCQSDLSLNFVCGDGQCSDENGKCDSGRGNLMVIAMQISHPHDDASYCWTVMRCVTWQSCPTVCSTVDTCTTLIRRFCKQSLFAFPDYPILFGHVHFIFSNNRSLIIVPDLGNINPDSIILLPDYLCYDKELCNDVLPVTTILLGGLTCRHFDFDFNSIDDCKWMYMIESIKKIFYQCLTIHDKKNETYCHHSSLYRCANSSKCISKYRLGDSAQDCYENDDEALNTHVNKLNSSINDIMMQSSISFPLLCDGYIDMNIDDILNGTDETHCNWWPCNNVYTRCDHIWNCPNGADEIDCGYLPLCIPPLHPCISPDSYSLTCLSGDRAGDGIVDCVGGTDEPHLCRENDLMYQGPMFRCWNDSLCLNIAYVYLCDGKKDCLLHDDELVCDRKYDFACFNLRTDGDNEIHALLCQSPSLKPDEVFLSLRNSIKYPEQSAIQYHLNTSLRTKPKLNNRDFLVVTATSLTVRQQVNEWKCNRGIHIRIRWNSSLSVRQCMCSPAYYGDFCQYQSQRVSLTLQVKAEADWRTTFSLVITLIDQQQVIESYDQIQYLAIRDCNVKFNINLLYLTRSKNISKNYSVRIDIYDRHYFTYRTSWIFPIIFPFLPVYRISTLLTIPIKTPEGCSLTCNHGRCIRFSNKNDDACQCDPGWSGSQCNIFYECQCSPDSLCVAGGWPSICICPLNKFGPQCYLTRYTCQPYTCEYRGRCIETDERIAMNNFTCICDEGYSGETCQYIDTKITITFREIPIPTSILCHFIMVHDNTPHTRITTFKRISLDQDSVSVYISSKFHLLFTQFKSNYYLTIVQEKYILSAKITTAIIPSQRCLHISELFNSTVLQFEHLRRIKLYHLACQQRFELKCLYDQIYICLCNTDRFANCFEFNHTMIYNCQGSSFCENEGHCFQDKPTCPTTLMCACAECFYGTRCQFSTIGFALSLDTILGYKIRPHITFTRQSTAIKISASIVIVMFVLGLVNSFLSILIFHTETSRNVGCGIYLLSTSIISLLTMIVFVLKFSILIYTQIIVDTHRSFLVFNCVSIDFLLRVLLSIGDWLNGCVAAERAFTVCKGVTFDRKKSKYIAKRIVLIVIFLNIFSMIHDPLHRRLIDDAEEKRTWCITSYSSATKLYDSIILLLHFLIPLFINSISTFVIIITVAKQRSTAQAKRPYKVHLRDQFHQKKYLLIPPCILVLLALPRLVLSFLSGCMKSPRDPWRFLIGYLVPFLPSILTFGVFVLPSKTYKKEFIDSKRRFRLRFC